MSDLRKDYDAATRRVRDIVVEMGRHMQEFTAADPAMVVVEATLVFAARLVAASLHDQGDLGAYGEIVKHFERLVGAHRLDMAARVSEKGDLQ